MYHIFVICLYIGLAYRFGDWRNWKKYYSTIQLYILGDFAYNFILFKYPLWHYVAPYVSHTILDLVYAGLVFPAVVFLLVPQFERQTSIGGKVKILLFWTLFAWVIEIFARRIGAIAYYNGWNLFYTLLFYLVLRLILILHHKRPLLASFISVGCGIATILYFHLGISK